MDIVSQRETVIVCSYLSFEPGRSQVPRLTWFASPAIWVEMACPSYLSSQKKRIVQSRLEVLQRAPLSLGFHLPTHWLGHEQKPWICSESSPFVFSLLVQAID